MPINSRSSHHFLWQWLRFISGAAYMLELIKHARWIQLYLSMSDHKWGIGISSIFDTGISVFANFCYGIAVLAPPPPPPKCPPHFVADFSVLGRLSDTSKYGIITGLEKFIGANLILFTNVGENCAYITTMERSLFISSILPHGSFMSRNFCFAENQYF